MIHPVLRTKPRFFNILTEEVATYVTTRAKQVFLRSENNTPRVVPLAVFRDNWIEVPE